MERCAMQRMVAVLLTLTALAACALPSSVQPVSVSYLFTAIPAASSTTTSSVDGDAVADDVEPQSHPALSVFVQGFFVSKLYGTVLFAAPAPALNSSEMSAQGYTPVTMTFTQQIEGMAPVVKVHEATKCAGATCVVKIDEVPGSVTPFRSRAAEVMDLKTLQTHARKGEVFMLTLRDGVAVNVTLNSFVHYAKPDAVALKAGLDALRRTVNEELLFMLRLRSGFRVNNSLANAEFHRLNSDDFICEHDDESICDREKKRMEVDSAVFLLQVMVCNPEVARRRAARSDALGLIRKVQEQLGHINAVAQGKGFVVWQTDGSVTDDDAGAPVFVREGDETHEPRLIGTVFGRIATAMKVHAETKSPNPTYVGAVVSGSSWLNLLSGA